MSILDKRIDELPISVIDFETTGLSANYDRVVEVSVVRIEPHTKPKLVFDSLINPQRSVGATFIHGIKDNDVKKAPTFNEIAGDVLFHLQGSIIASYNIYFDIKFLKMEFNNIGMEIDPPHLCVMYLRKISSNLRRCSLDSACRLLDITIGNYHTSAADTVAASKIMLQNIHDLKQKKNI